MNVLGKAVRFFSKFRPNLCEFCGRDLIVDDSNWIRLKLRCPDHEDEFHKDCRELKQHYFKDLNEAKERLSQESEELADIYKKSIMQVRQEHWGKR